MSISSLIEESGTLCSILAEAADGQAPAQTDMGGADRSDADWLAIADGVPCLVRTISSSLDRDYSDERAARIEARIYLASDPVPAGLSSRHRIAVTGPGRGGPRVLGTYAVTGIIDPNSLGILLQVECERIRTP